MPQRMPSWAALASSMLPSAASQPRSAFMRSSRAGHAGDDQQQAGEVAAIHRLIEDEACRQGDQDEVQRQHRIGAADFHPLQEQQPAEQAEPEGEQRQPRPRTAQARRPAVGGDQAPVLHGELLRNPAEAGHEQGGEQQCGAHGRTCGRIARTRLPFR